MEVESKKIVFSLNLLLVTLSLSANAYACEINTAWSKRAPYQFLNKQRKPDGFDIQFIRAVGKELNCTVNIVQRSWGGQHRYSVEGKQDLLLGSMDWDENVDYYVSDPYRSDPIGAYWNGPISEDDTDKSLLKLLSEGNKFGFNRHVQRSDSLKKAMRNPRFKSQLISVDNEFGVIRHLKKGRMKGGFIHLATAEEFLAVHGRDNIYLNKHLSYDNPSSFLLSKTSPLGYDFLDRLNQAIAKLKKDGTQERLRKKYLLGYTIESVE